MQIKFNWGTGIVLFLIIFLFGIATLIYITSQQKINLVTPEYYPKGINYEDEIQKKENFQSLQESIKISQDAHEIYIQLPYQDSLASFNGEILFYRPADFEDDTSFAIKHSYGSFSKSIFKTGRYIIKADWTEDSIPYYNEVWIDIKK